MSDELCTMDLVARHIATASGAIEAATILVSHARPEYEGPVVDLRDAQDTLRLVAGNLNELEH